MQQELRGKKLISQNEEKLERGIGMVWNVLEHNKPSTHGAQCPYCSSIDKRRGMTTLHHLSFLLKGRSSWGGYQRA